MAGKGSIYVVSSPSGGGKGTILGRVLAKDPQISYTVSVTTRAPRSGEVAGDTYTYVDRETFDQMIREDQFLEWAEVHGNRYGTTNEELDQKLSTGHDVVLELDVQGMRSVKGKRPEAISVFIMPPSLDELERRIRERGGTDEKDIALRLQNARVEMAARDEYDFVVHNDDLKQAVRDFEEILRRERTKH